MCFPEVIRCNVGGHIHKECVVGTRIEWEDVEQGRRCAARSRKICRTNQTGDCIRNWRFVYPKVVRPLINQSADFMNFIGLYYH